MNVWYLHGSLCIHIICKLYLKNVSLQSSVNAYSKRMCNIYIYTQYTVCIVLDTIFIVLYYVYYNI